MKLKPTQEEAKKELLASYIKPTTTLIIQITHQSYSGLSRKMKIYTIDKKSQHLQYLTHLIARLVDYKLNKDDTITVKGCGMDMTFWLADLIPYRLYNGKTPKTAKGNGGTCLDWQAIY